MRTITHEIAALETFMRKKGIVTYDEIEAKRVVGRMFADGRFVFDEIPITAADLVRP